jgi:hypothetical protein
MTENPRSDPIEHFLERSSGLPPSQARETLLFQTRRLVRGRRRRKQLVLALALIGCYLAGAVTMQAWVRGITPPPETTNLQRIAKPPGEIALQTPTAPSHSAVPVPLDRDPDVPAALVELIAARSPGHQALLYRNAGDRYLRDLGDLESALRCYRLALASPESDLSLDPEDNWILMALKQARQKEKSNAKNGG